MKKNTLMVALISGILTLGAAVVAMAAVPPPPVNQFIGFPDTTQQFKDRTGCLQAAPCHQNDTVVVAFHHALTNAPRLLSCYGDPTAAVVTGCHQLVRNPVTGAMDFLDFRDCFRCHTNQPHHVSARAKAQDCQGCHGNKLIDNPLDGHVIPTYAKSSVTPETKWRGNLITNPLNYGGCAACHQQSSTTTPLIFTNAETHHGTGIGQPTADTGLPVKVGDCTWCHAGGGSLLDIRVCERCHGVKSLHNIQVNSRNPADTNPANIVPNGELPGYGHIGSDFDCWGCHGTFKKYAADAPFEYTIPPSSLNGLSTTALTSGVETALTLTGSGFKTVFAVNKLENVPVNVRVLVSNETASLTLTPVSVTDSEIQVVIPALANGNYSLSVSKDDGYNHLALSNIALIHAVPARSITTASLGTDKTLTITGTGFNMEPPADVKTGLGVFAADGTAAKIISWSDTKVVVSGATLKVGDTVTVKTLYGPVAKIMVPANKKARR